MILEAVNQKPGFKIHSTRYPCVICSPSKRRHCGEIIIFAGCACKYLNFRFGIAKQSLTIALENVNVYACVFDNKTKHPSILCRHILPKRRSSKRLTH